MCEVTAVANLWRPLWLQIYEDRCGYKFMKLQRLQIYEDRRGYKCVNLQLLHIYEDIVFATLSHVS